MRQILPLFCLLMLISLGQATAQTQPKSAFSYRYTLYNFQTPLADNPNWYDIWGNAKGVGAELAYQHRLFQNGYLVVPLKFGVTDISDGSGPARRHLLGNLDALLQYHFFKYGNAINPFLHAGIGSAYDFDASSDEFDLNVPIGLGFNIRLLEGLYINPQTQYRVSFNDKTHWQHGVGFTAFFGGKKEPEMPKDTDKDGIPDVSDKCVDVPGVASAMGCPDRDGDGVADRDDRCPDQPGLASNKGCPEMKKEDKAKVELAVKAVQFETGKAVLLPQSKKVLDDVAAVLIKYPEYNLSISGHTDNTGSAAANKKLSEDRAKACYDYLVSKGVAASRLSHAGYGDTKPVGDNKTAAGRAANRRTEFDLMMK